MENVFNEITRRRKNKKAFNEVSPTAMAEETFSFSEEL